MYKIDLGYGTSLFGKFIFQRFFNFGLWWPFIWPRSKIFYEIDFCYISSCLHKKHTQKTTRINFLLSKPQSEPLCNVLRIEKKIRLFTTMPILWKWFAPNCWTWPISWDTLICKVSHSTSTTCLNSPSFPGGSDLQCKFACFLNFG